MKRIHLDSSIPEKNGDHGSRTATRTQDRNLLGLKMGTFNDCTEYSAQIMQIFSHELKPDLFGGSHIPKMILKKSILLIKGVCRLLFLP